MKVAGGDTGHGPPAAVGVLTNRNMGNENLIFNQLLRDTKIYSEPYFGIIDIIVGQEDAFRDFNEFLKKE